MSLPAVAATTVANIATEDSLPSGAGTWGTAGDYDTTDLGWRLTGAGLQMSEEKISEEINSNVDWPDRERGPVVGQTVTGSISTLLYSTGDENTVRTKGGIGFWLDHAFVREGGEIDSFSIETSRAMNDPDTPTYIAATEYLGCRVNTFTINWSSDSLVTADIDIIAKEAVAASTPMDVNARHAGNPLHGARTTVSIGGNSLEVVESGSITINNNLTPGPYLYDTSDDTFIISSLTPGFRVITGSFRVLFSTVNVGDSGILAQLRELDETQTSDFYKQIIITIGTQDNTATTDDVLTITIPKASVTAAVDSFGDQGDVVMYDVTWEAYAVGNPAATFVLA